MALSTKTRTAQNSAIAGLDSLELGQGQGGRSQGRFARQLWRSAWPKLLAIVIVLATWQLFYAVNFRGDTASGLVKGPVTTLGGLAHQLGHAQLWQAIDDTLRTAVSGYLLALVIGTAV